MRKGKMIAQGAHASLGAVWVIEASLEASTCSGSVFDSWREPYESWKGGTFTKVCVYVNSAEELHELQTRAEIADLPNKLIIDNGATEFHGVPTETCLAIGPAWSEDIDKITGHLPLL